MYNFETEPQQNPESRPEEGMAQKLPEITVADSMKKETYGGPDFAIILQNNPPIEGIFSPEKELKKIKRLPHDDKETALETFKEKLIRQRIAWAQCRVVIERLVEFNPEAPQKEMLALVEKFGSYYGFSKKQKSLAGQIIDRYIVQHKLVKEVREKYPKDKELVEHLTGMKLAETDDLSVSIGPLSVDIRMDPFNFERIHQNSDNPVMDVKYGGMSSQSKHLPPIFYTVLNTKYARPSTPVHEMEHHKNVLSSGLNPKRHISPDAELLLRQGGRAPLREVIMEKLFGFERNVDEELYLAYENEKDMPTKTFLLEGFFKLRLSDGLARAKNEILAMKKDRRPYTYDFFFKQDGLAHDYFAGLRNYKSEEDDPLWVDMMEKIFADEYKPIVSDAIEAFDRLEKGGYIREEVIAMLSDKSLAEWPKTARRLLGQREERKTI